MFAHIDADAFFASVLQRKYPQLRNKPLLALGMGGGCVIAASYEAKSMGVKTGMRLREAKKIAPDAIAVPSDFRATYEATVQLFSVLEKYCPGGVERASPDEGYLDLQSSHSYHLEPFVITPHFVRSRRTSTFAQASVDKPRGKQDRLHRRMQNANEYERMKLFATDLQSHFHHYLDLPVSIGIAPTKTLAKMASKHRKPKGICIILPENISSFLQEKTIDAIPGIGRRLTPKLQQEGILTAADFAQMPREDIGRLLGKTGLALQEEIQGIPVYRIITEPDPPQSISRCRSFRATNDMHFLYAQIVMHLQRCSSTLRRHGMECRRLGVWLRQGYEGKLYAERMLGRYVCEEALLLPHAKEAFKEAIGMPLGDIACAVHTRQRFTQTGLVLSDLQEKRARQLSLFENARALERLAAVQETLDALRKRFGQESVLYGGAL